MAFVELPGLPAPLPELVDYIADNPEKPLEELMGPYREYEAQLRTVFAQDRRDPRLDNPHINVLPLFTDKTDRVTVRARDLAAESQEEKDRYIMALPDDMRRPHASPATAGSLKEFRKNFGIFSENSLADLDWDNVVAAGSSVVNCLLPVPDEFNSTKRKLREYYHKKFCPASDVDLFLYGLNEQEAIEKIKKIEQAIRDSILSEVTVVRTKYAITIVSQYPTRHVQVVLRSYKSVSEILTGFDIDAAGGAYDGKQVYVTPRALGSFITQINQVDLSRRSPSYENRLSKYSHRNFEVYWPELDRSKVDPTIFERSFGRTLGLARLLVLERLPTSDSRESYLNQRRRERGRPVVQSSRFRLKGNIKDSHEDEIADWVDETEVANYHTFTVPYGEFFHAKKIEKLCYTKDLLLNAEWNLQRDVYLHRHPAFFGRVQDVIEDCCGYCPKPVTPEEIETAEKDAEIYISGKIKFLIDDPGRQQIGSFNPLTEDDWTDMAYVGNTARLYQSIVDSDVDEVMAWLSQPDVDVNRRDHTGRTPLQLAVICSTPDVVKCLIDNGARLIARMADGQTALHLAAVRGDPDIVQLLMEKSVLNEEVEEERQDQERKLKRPTSDDENDPTAENEADDDGDEDESDMEMVGEEDSDDAAHSFTTGSFVKVKAEETNTTKEFEEPNDSEPDFYNIDVLAWDIPTSPLHLAIVSGHEDVVKVLCDFGGDALLPIKLLNSERNPSGAILTLTLAAKLPLEKAKSMAKLLLDLGATTSQADLSGRTPFHVFVESGHGELVDVLLEHNQIGGKTAINHMAISPGYEASAYTPIQIAISKGDLGLVLKLINAGAILKIDFDTWLKATKLIAPQSYHLRSFESSKREFDTAVASPLIVALERSTDADLAMALLEHGADPNCMTEESYSIMEYFSRWRKGETALDIVRQLLNHLRRFKGLAVLPKPVLAPGMDEYIAEYAEGTYQHWMVSKVISGAKKTYEDDMRTHEQSTCRKYLENDKTAKAQTSAVKDKTAVLEKLEAMLLSKGAKSFAELHPEIAEKAPDIYLAADADESNTKAANITPYKYEFKFPAVDGLTGPRRAAYVELFEAAWRGDLEKIKSLTLGAWGEAQSESPLEVTAMDNDRNTPFSLAFFLGHYDVAWDIAEIAHAQYSPPDEEKRIYEIRMDGGDDDDDEDSEAEYSSDDDEDVQPRVAWKNADNHFTIDNVGEVSTQVKSRFKALESITRDCNVFLAKDGVPDPKASSKMGSPWALFVNYEVDGIAFHRLLDMCIHFGGKKYEATPGTDYASFALSADSFADLVKSGKVELLKEVIRRTGTGIPLDDLVEKTGVEVTDKPRYYQGLSVYGKKRNDWATAGRETFDKPTGLGTAPLLHAAKSGRREAVEWFLSDEPLKLYMKFSQSKAAKEDSRIAHLNASPGGFKSAVTKWLGDRNELVLHCAVMGLETDEGIGLVKHLIETYPAAVDAKDKCGNTPLLTAAYLGRTKYMKLLIDGGADQSARNNEAQNVIHCLLGTYSSADKLRPALDLLHEGLRTHLFKQRQSLRSGGHTPLHTLVETLRCDSQRAHHHWGASAFEDAEGVVGLLLEYSRGDELDILDASGETPLHTAAMASYPWLAEVLARFRPKLMYIENAVGRTPAEIALGEFMSEALSDYKHTRHMVSYADPKHYIQHVIQATGPIVEDRHLHSKDRMWALCRGVVEEHPDRRRLVSLHEASDVANRLSGKYTSKRYFAADPKEEERDEDAGRDEMKYLVRSWVSRGLVTAWTTPEMVADAEKAKEGEGEECDHCGGRHVWSDKGVLGGE